MSHMNNLFTLRDNLIEEAHPWGIITIHENEGVNTSSKPLRGEWVRVFPQTGKDVRFLQMLSHQEEKFAPTHGGGVLVKRELM